MDRNLDRARHTKLVVLAVASPARRDVAAELVAAPLDLDVLAGSMSRT